MVRLDGCWSLVERPGPPVGAAYGSDASEAGRSTAVSPDGVQVVTIEILFGPSREHDLAAVSGHVRRDRLRRKRAIQELSRRASEQGGGSSGGRLPGLSSGIPTTDVK